jgi:hypothetical protein
MNTEPTIFISIASYRDAELIPTLRDMLANTSSPSRLHIAICWQDNGDISPFLAAGMTQENQGQVEGFPLITLRWQQAIIDVIVVHYYHSQGACWARYIAEHQLHDEDYFLQIDSHCRFAPQWDSHAIAMLNSLKSNSAKPVLSTYPPAYEPGKETERKQFINRLIFREFTPDKIAMMSSTTFKSNSPVRGGYLAGGFIFAEGSFPKEVPNDPHIFFAGEEIAMAARAFTHGYDIWSPHEILLWHYYGRREHPKVWSDHNNEARGAGDVSLAWWERDKISKRRVRTLLGVECSPCDLAEYELGNARSFADFECMLGVDFTEQTVRQEVVSQDKVSWFEYATRQHEGWRQRLVRPNKKQLKIDKAQFTAHQTDTHSWHICVYTEDNRLINKQIIEQDSLSTQLASTPSLPLEISLNFTCPAVQHPHVIRISPFSLTHGWGDVLELPW